jgi:ComF family protein
MHTCLECAQHTNLERVLVRYVYRGLSKNLLWKLKSNGTQAAAYLIANHAKRLLSTDKELLIIPVPTATVRVRQRGYDQARLIAAQLARQTGLHWATCLVRQGQAHQVGADRAQRLQQLRQAFRIVRPYLVQDTHILLVDDVITTGASFEAAAHVLSEAGAASVSALAFARPALQIKKPTL